MTALEARVLSRPWCQAPNLPQRHCFESLPIEIPLRGSGERIYKIPFAKWIEPSYIGIMKTTVTLDKAGRVVLPKTLRDELHLAPGDTIDLMVEGEGVTLRPRRTVPPLQKERGVWVFRIGEPLTAMETRETLRGIRERRARRDAGESK